MSSRNGRADTVGMIVAIAASLALIVGLIEGGGWLLGRALDRWPAATLLTWAAIVGVALIAVLLRCATALLSALAR